MKCWLGAALLTMLTFSVALGQHDRSQIYANPIPPRREALERLNLKMAWYTYIPLDGLRDGLTAVKFTGKHLLVQTRSGMVAQVLAESGKSQWRTHVGNPYQNLHTLTYNSNMVLVLNNNYLFGLDRADGQVQYQMTLPGGVSTSPAADDEQIYLPMVGQLRTYRLPNMTAERAYQAARREEEAKAASLRELVPQSGSPYETPKIRLPPPGARYKVGPQPFEVWYSAQNVRLDYPMQITSDVVLGTGADGTLVSFAKYLPGQTGSASPVFRFRPEGKVLGPPGVYEDVCYLGSSDANVYAILTTSGRVLWRYTAGTTVARQPLATRSDVFVSSERNGLARLDRETGVAQWRIPRGKRMLSSQPDVDQVLAVNPKFVYATDRSGRLVVLDRVRGTILSTWDVRDFVFLIPNEWNDRLYLAAQNGLLICLHDREYGAPVFHKEFENSLIRKLQRRVTIPVIQNRPLREVLRELSIDLQIKIEISTAAFKQAGREPPIEVAITKEKTEDTLDKALAAILKLVDATYKQVDDFLLVVPLPKQDMGM